MKNWWQSLRSDMVRCLCAPRFALAILMITGIRILGIVQEVYFVGVASVLYLHHVEDPDLLILDEPMNGLDNGGVRDVRKLP